MTKLSAEKAHAEHLELQQEHFQWSVDHLKAMAILHRVQARLIEHHIETPLHRAEIARHEEALKHGSAAEIAAITAEHEALNAKHAAARAEHEKLMKAVQALEDLVR